MRYNWEWNNAKTLRGTWPQLTKRLIGFIGLDYVGHVTYVHLCSQNIDRQTATIANLTGVQRLELPAPRLQVLESPLSDGGLGRLKGMV